MRATTFRVSGGPRGRCSIGILDLKLGVDVSDRVSRV